MSTNSDLAGSLGSPQEEQTAVPVSKSDFDDAETAVRITDVSKYYPSAKKKEDFLALTDVNLDVKRGEFVSIIGPSGSGKTTLLKCIDGLVGYERGEIVVVPDAHKQDRKRSRDRAFVFQDFGLLPWRTVQDNVMFPLEILKWNKQERHSRALELIELVGLQDFAKHHPHQLSGGMRQRVGLARALAVNPDVLLMDEPLGALDEQTREVMQAELLEICAQTGKTVIFVTHSVDEAIFMSDRIVVMSKSPGTVRAILDVTLAKPRTRMETRADPEFGRLREAVWDELGINDIKQIDELDIPH